MDSDRHGAGRGSWWLIVAGLILVTIGLAVVMAFVSARAPVSPLGPKWQLVKGASDEFRFWRLDGDKWDASTTRSYQVSCDPHGTPRLAFVPDNVTVSGGELRITARKQRYRVPTDGCGVTKPTVTHTGGFVESRFNVPGGPSMVEVRAKALDSRANVLSAIWLQNFPLAKARNPNIEIDLLETFTYTQMWSTVYRWKCGDHRRCGAARDRLARAGGQTGVGDVSAGFHTYGMERRDGWVRFFFDRRQVWAYRAKPGERDVVSQPRHVILSLEAHLGKPVDAHLPSAFEVDYVHTYRYAG